MNDVTSSIAHTMWNCKYHIVFAPKYRRMVFFKEKKIQIGQILRKLCEHKGVEIIEAEGGLRLALVGAADSPGLCPKRKNHQLGWWIIIII